MTYGKPLPCYFDEDARAERQRFMRLVERLQADPTLPTIIRETAPKWSGLLARLALVFHLVELAEQRKNGSETDPRRYLPGDWPNCHQGGELPPPHRPAQPVPARFRDHARGGGCSRARPLDRPAYPRARRRDDHQ